MIKLIEILKSETSSLKTQYIEKRLDWAKKYFSACMERRAWNEEQWAKYLGVPTAPCNVGTPSEFISFAKGFHNSAASKRYHNLRNDGFRLFSNGLENFLLKEQKSATTHYEESIKKLADRIAKKGLEIDNLTVITSHIGVNINTTLTDGNKTVRAFTIIAEGEIQCPHYRYVIK